MAKRKPIPAEYADAWWRTVARRVADKITPAHKRKHSEQQLVRMVMICRHAPGSLEIPSFLREVQLFLLGDFRFATEFLAGVAKEFQLPRANALRPRDIANLLSSPLVMDETRAYEHPAFSEQRAKQEQHIARRTARSYVHPHMPRDEARLGGIAAILEKQTGKSADPEAVEKALRYLRDAAAER